MTVAQFYYNAGDGDSDGDNYEEIRNK